MNNVVRPRPVANLANYRSDNEIHQEVARLVENGVKQSGLRSERADDGLWRVTVMIDSTRSWKHTIRRPGHAGIALWRATTARPPFKSMGILADGDLASEGVKRSELTYSDTLDLWYLTREINRDQAHGMLNRIEDLKKNENRRYNEFAGNRYKVSYNCVSFVDDILSYGGVSSTWVRPASWLTPWIYSFSFRVKWHSSVIYNAKNL